MTMVAKGQINFQYKKHINQPSSQTSLKPTPENPQQPQKNTKEQIEGLIKSTDTPLFTFSTIFPFDLFPDTVVIDTRKVSILNKEFFWSGRTQSIMIKDVRDVLVETSPFFAKLTVVDKGFTENSVSLRFLKKSDALKARRIIQGLIIAADQNIDLTKLKPEEVGQKVEELGKIKTG